MENGAFTELTLNHLDGAFYGPAWHGAALMETLAGLTLEQALFENHEGFCAWKVALHCAYWKHVVINRLLDMKNNPFERSPDDFPDLPSDRSLKSYEQDLDFLRTKHERLREAIRKMPAEKLIAVPEAEKPLIRMVLGVPAHDAYHTAHIRNLGIPGLE